RGSWSLRWTLVVVRPYSPRRLEFGSKLVWQYYPATTRGGTDGTFTGRYRARFRSRDHRGPDPVPRLDRRLLGRAVLAPQELHACVHDRARLHGQDQARVRPP